MMAGVEMLHVPYKGGPQALQDVIGGQIEFATIAMPEALPQVRAGRVRALGQTGIKRSSIAPDIPTFDESGLKGYTVMTWYVVFAPVKTPSAIVQRVHEEFDKVLKVQEVQDRLREAGLTEIVNGPPDAAAKLQTYIKNHQTQPCRHTLSFCSSRQAMTCVALENTDSISTDSIGSVGSSGRMTRLTKKCFCLAMGITAVHLVNNSFLGFRGFIRAGHHL